MFHVEHRPRSKCSTWNIGVFESHPLFSIGKGGFSRCLSPPSKGLWRKNVPRGTSATLKMFHVEHRGLREPSAIWPQGEVLSRGVCAALGASGRKMFHVEHRQSLKMFHVEHRGLREPSAISPQGEVL